MLVCVSLNPAIDKRLPLGVLQVGKVNRARKAEAAPGGKATHVATVLRTLGAEPLWLGFAGGATGEALVEGLRKMEIQVESVTIAGSTRTNLEICDDEANVTEILEPGPQIAPEELQKFEERFEEILARSTEIATVTLSGSLPLGVPNGYYANLIALAHKHRSRVFLDTSGEPLKLGLTACPDFVKPNKEEAEWLSGSIIQGPGSAVDVLHELLQIGAATGAISLGSDGLVWQSKKEERVLIAWVPKQDSRSCVGSGDATLAGFAFAAQRDLSSVDALRLAAACGVANCLTDGPGRARAVDIARLRKEIRIEALEVDGRKGRSFRHAK